MPLASGEGPVCLIMGPSRELVRQIHEVVQEICAALAKDHSTRYPEIRAALITGAWSKHQSTTGLVCNSMMPVMLSLSLVQFRPLAWRFWCHSSCRCSSERCDSGAK